MADLTGVKQLEGLLAMWEMQVDSMAHAVAALQRELSGVRGRVRTHAADPGAILGARRVLGQVGAKMGPLAAEIAGASIAVQGASAALSSASSALAPPTEVSTSAEMPSAPALAVPAPFQSVADSRAPLRAHDAEAGMLPPAKRRNTATAARDPAPSASAGPAAAAAAAPVVPPAPTGGAASTTPDVAAPAVSGTVTSASAAAAGAVARAPQVLLQAGTASCMGPSGVRAMRRRPAASSNDCAILFTDGTLEIWKWAAARRRHRESEGEGVSEGGAATKAEAGAAERPPPSLPPPPPRNELKHSATLPVDGVRIPAESGRMGDVAWSPCGGFLAATLPKARWPRGQPDCGGPQVLVYRVARSAEKSRAIARSSPLHEEGVSALAWLPQADGRGPALVTGGGRCVVLWRCCTWATRRPEVAVVHSLHTAALGAVATRGDDCVLSGAADGRVVLWSVSHGRAAYSARFARHAVRALEPLPGSESVFLAGLARKGEQGHCIAVLDARAPPPQSTGAAVAALAIDTQRPTQLLSVRPSACGTFVASTNQQSKILLWDLRAAGGGAASSPHQELGSTISRTAVVEWHPSSTALVAGGNSRAFATVLGQLSV